ncbi:MAG: sugar nucleotide-binding protein [Candidatus Coatesbacteria bacterium]|nr:sugar nucleotide-binding protein [Candidatus Coatesbacteria bacterium]
MSYYAFCCYKQCFGSRKKKDIAEVLNIKSTIDLVEIARKINIPFIFLSTDMVFSGNNPVYKEEAIPHPVNYYGFTKLQAEKTVLSYKKGIVLRIALVYGFSSSANKNFFEKTVENLKSGNEIESYIDQYRTPISLKSLISNIITIWQSNKYGLFHLSGGTRISRYDMNLKIAEYMGADKSLIIPVVLKKLPVSRLYPMDLSLSSLKANNTFGLKEESIDEGLEFYFKNGI